MPKEPPSLSSWVSTKKGTPRKAVASRAQRAQSGREPAEVSKTGRECCLPPSQPGALGGLRNAAARASSRSKHLLLVYCPLSASSRGGWLLTRTPDDPREVGSCRLQTILSSSPGEHSEDGCGWSPRPRPRLPAAAPEVPRRSSYPWWAGATAGSDVSPGPPPMAPFARAGAGSQGRRPGLRRLSVARGVSFSPRDLVVKCPVSSSRTAC